jgi:uncharacterized membrane protein
VVFLFSLQSSRWSFLVSFFEACWAWVLVGMMLMRVGLFVLEITAVGVCDELLDFF